MEIVCWRFEMCVMIITSSNAYQLYQNRSTLSINQKFVASRIVTTDLFFVSIHIYFRIVMIRESFSIIN